MDTIITQLDRPTVRYLRKQLEAAIEPLAEKLGVAIALGTCTFQMSNCKFQLKIAVLDASGEAVTEEAESFKESAKLFGLEAADLGKQFIFQGQSYTICGLRPKSRKYPVVVRAGNGKSYKFPCRTVLQALNKQVPPWLGQ